MSNIIIAGTPRFSKYPATVNTILAAQARGMVITQVIAPSRPGPDTFAKIWAERNGIPILSYRRPRHNKKGSQSDAWSALCKEMVAAAGTTGGIINLWDGNSLEDYHLTQRFSAMLLAASVPKTAANWFIHSSSGAAYGTLSHPH